MSAPTSPADLVILGGGSGGYAAAFRASELGLNKKVGEFWTFAEPALREVNRLIALEKGDKALAQATRLAKVNHMNPEIRSEAQLADMMVKLKTIGFPLEYLMELYGIEALEIPRIMALRDKELNDPQLAAATRALGDIVNPPVGG